MDKPTANEITGGLSKPSKMPGYSYGLPAEFCKTGSHLRKIPNTVCSSCYAFKGRYRMSGVAAAQLRRFNSLTHPHWVEAMAYLIATVPKSKRGYFRWHDSGDIQDMAHLCNIISVCLLTPEVQHWLPTREVLTVYNYTKHFGQFPKNLNIRVSAPIVGEGYYWELMKNRPMYRDATVSSVHYKYVDLPPTVHACPAQSTNNECGACRACWDREVSHVSYPLH